MFGEFYESFAPLLEFDMICIWPAFLSFSVLATELLKASEGFEEKRMNWERKAGKVFKFEIRPKLIFRLLFSSLREIYHGVQFVKVEFCLFVVVAPIESPSF